MSIASTDVTELRSLHSYAKLFAAAYDLPVDNGFVLLLERDDEYLPFGWAAQLPVAPFTPFYSFAVALETGETLRRCGSTGEDGRWV